MSEHNTPEAQEAQAGIAVAPECEEKTGNLEIKIKDQGENETLFRIKKHAQLGKVFEAYCSRRGLNHNTVRLLFYGIRVQENETPEGLDIESGDLIEAVLEQVGGDDTAESGSPGTAAAEDEKPEEKAGTISIKVKDQNENETFFKIKGHTRLGKVFHAYCERQSLTRNTVRFLFDGSRLQETDTPESLDMQDGDMIQAMLEQQGGVANEETEGGEQQAEGQKISIKVKDVHGREVEFKCKSTTVLKKLMDAFCNQLGRKPDSLRFFTPDGKRVTNTDTPGSLNLEDGDLIDVQEEQQGGGASNISLSLK